MELLNEQEINQLMEMLEISEQSQMSVQQFQAGVAADKSMMSLVELHGCDEALGACARYLRKRVIEAAGVLVDEFDLCREN